ncbi:hypothetical protein [Aureibacter tunicatorum]|uniref:Uncharacterized protein n=1 Tax=Aureibacter tunicatorum TaxID=866807 RepID=A0AAE3XME7_9BACT|nr:hypothetical protein [Aureibacter tunicatorum]MDR6237649.1 hypothetical protein [Aureibacter tunicatorum]BDD02684.1 hypothetical protein AUTU_01670 [Aureibacter tunicatorum]
MKQLLLILFIVISFKGVSQNKNISLGMRFIDPTGISIKKYLTETSAFEFNIGRTNFKDDEMKDGFNDWNKEIHKSYYTEKYLDNKKVHDFKYVGVENSIPLSFQLHYLLSKKISASEDLFWYYGGGLQARYKTYQFKYYYRKDKHYSWQPIKSDKIKDFDMGIDIATGLEYTFSEAPISMFADVIIYMEIIDDSFATNLQGGVGARYNF